MPEAGRPLARATSNYHTTEFLVPAAARETTGISVAHDLGADPGGLPRDRNTPRIETRRISDLETLGNHEPQVSLE